MDDWRQRQLEQNQREREERLQCEREDSLLLREQEERLYRDREMEESTRKSQHQPSRWLRGLGFGSKPGPRTRKPRAVRRR